MSKEVYQDALHLITSSLEIAEADYNKAMSAMQALGSGIFPELYEQCAERAEVEARKIDSLKLMNKLLLENPPDSPKIKGLEPKVGMSPMETFLSTLGAPAIRGSSSATIQTLGLAPDEIDVEEINIGNVSIAIEKATGDVHISVYNMALEEEDE